MKEIHLYNSLTNKIEVFTPIKEGEVSMYVCGPTVYNYPHIGNMRPVVTFDTLRNFLEYVGYKVTYVSNFTDVDDKIINAAKEQGLSEKELTDFYISAFKETIHALGSRDPDITPRPTEYMDKIIAYIEDLERAEAAYNVNGDVYFRVSKIPHYGALSGINVEDLLVGARIEENKDKESPLDFALWKKTDVGIKWPTKWGEGRPGWHTECCVMIDSIFHDKIDIHGGGYDLKFPHHENEIAQCEALHHHSLANYWMHNAFININNEKMSKSLGNVIYAKDLIKEHGGAVVRLVILTTHYRMPVSFTDDTVLSASQNINKITMATKQLALKIQSLGLDLNSGKPLYIDGFVNALADDLNTSNALTELYNLIKEANMLLRTRDVDNQKLLDVFKTLLDMYKVLGLDIPYVILNDEEKALYNEYLDAKANKDFAKSDALRDELIKKNIL